MISRDRQIGAVGKLATNVIFSGSLTAPLVKERKAERGKEPKRRPREAVGNMV